MKQIEVQLREGMAQNGIAGGAAEQIITSISSFALYGFPESHAASFALLAYASAYFKAHYPAAFFAAMLNNQPMGFYHPATLVKDAQRHGVRFASIDVQRSGWLCTVESDGAVRLGLRYVTGLREEAGRAVASASESEAFGPERCPKCGCDDRSMLEVMRSGVSGGSTGPGWFECFCNTCAHDWRAPVDRRRFASVDDLVRRIGKDKTNISRKARELGLTNQSRKGISKYDLSISTVIELFEGFVSEQPITLSQFARNRSLWPHGLSQLFRRHGYAKAVSDLIRKRRQLPENIRIRFEKRFVKGRGCWEWRGARDNHGYGRFSAFGTSKAHRVSYQVYREPPNRELMVCHHCDNPPCVRPDHLFLGNAKDNVQDAVRKGRHGRMNGKQK
jgi:hypothetical protein